MKEQEPDVGTTDLCRNHGTCSATVYKWKVKFGGLEVSDARRLKTLEGENNRLKNLLAEAMVNIAMLKDVEAKNGDARRRTRCGGSCLPGARVSQRRACEALSVDRSSVRYRSQRPDNRELREAMKAVAAQRRGFGYHRINVMLQRQGIAMNIKKLRRLYAEEKRQVRKRGRKCALGTRQLIIVPDPPNQRWSLDFFSDPLTDARQFRVLNLVNDHTRQCLALVVDTSLSVRRVMRKLDAVIARRGEPNTVVSGNGIEFTSMAILRLSPDRLIDWHYIAPGTAMQNGPINSFNGSFRDECLNETRFSSFAKARSGSAQGSRLQRSQTAFVPGQSYAPRIQQHHGTGKTRSSGPNINSRTRLKTGEDLEPRSPDEARFERAAADLRLGEKGLVRRAGTIRRRLSHFSSGCTGVIWHRQAISLQTILRRRLALGGVPNIVPRVATPLKMALTWNATRASFSDAAMVNSKFDKGDSGLSAKGD